MAKLSVEDFRKPIKYEIAGIDVYIVPMMSSLYVELQKQFNGKQEIDPELMAKVVVDGVHDDEGQAIFPTVEVALQLSPGILAELFVQCSTAAGFKSKDDPEKN